MGDDAEKQIDRKLRGAACADIAEVNRRFAQPVKERGAVFKRFGRAAGKNDKLAFGRRSHGAGYRGVHINAPGLFRKPRESLRFLSQNRAHIDDVRAFPQMGENAVLAFQHLPDRFALRQHQEDNIGFIRSLGRSLAENRPLSSKRLRSFRCPVIHMQAISGLNQISGHRYAHMSCSDPCDLFQWNPLLLQAFSVHSKP
ncbi:hypothetical protein D3C71_1096770 [compost metagenome]